VSSEWGKVAGYRLPVTGEEIQLKENAKRVIQLVFDQVEKWEIVVIVSLTFS
jgi:hypothetical protein